MSRNFHCFMEVIIEKLICVDRVTGMEQDATLITGTCILLIRSMYYR